MKTGKSLAIWFRIATVAFAACFCACGSYGEQLSVEAAAKSGNVVETVTGNIDRDNVSIYTAPATYTWHQSGIASHVSAKVGSSGYTYDVKVPAGKVAKVEITYKSYLKTVDEASEPTLKISVNGTDNRLVKGQSYSKTFETDTKLTVRMSAIVSVSGASPTISIAFGSFSIKVTYTDKPEEELRPDLIVASMVVSPTEVSRAQNVAVEFSARNAGNAQAAATCAYVYDAADGLMLGEAPVPSVPVGGTVSGNCTIPAGKLSVGNHPVYVKLDATGLVGEMNEGNNESERRTITVVDEAPAVDPHHETVAVRFHLNGLDALVDKTQDRYFVVGEPYSKGDFLVPQEDGRNFMGWTTSDGKPVEASDTVTADIRELYAQWRESATLAAVGICFYLVDDGVATQLYTNLLYRVNSAYGTLPDMPDGSPGDWFAEPSLTTPVSASTVASVAVVRLYAALPKVEPVEPLEVGVDAVEIPALGGSVDIPLRGGGDWHASPNDDWFTVTEDTPAGGVKTLHLFAPENTTGALRQGSITVSGGGASKRVLVCQRVPDVERVQFSAKSADVPADGGSGQFTVRIYPVVLPNGTSVLPYQGPRRSGGWFSCSESLQTFDDDDPVLLTMDYVVEANDSTEPRQGHIYFILNESEYGFVITQAGRPGSQSAVLSLGESSRSIGAEGERSDVSVSCDAPWSVARSDFWIVLDATEGNGDGKIGYRILPNTDGEPRTGYITVSSGGVSQTMTITQLGQPASPTPVSIAISGPAAVDASSGNRYVCTLTMSDGSTRGVLPMWSIESGRGASIDGSGMLWAFNDEACSTEVTIRADSEEGGAVLRATMAVTIRAAEIYAQFENEERIHTHAGGDGEIWVYGSGRWTASPSEDWIGVVDMQGSGSRIVSYTVGRNEGEDARTGQIVLSNGNEVLATLAIIQDGTSVGRVFSVDRESVSVDHVGSWGQCVIVKSTAPWVASTDADWLTVTKAGGAGDGILKFEVARACEHGPRTGVISIAAGGSTLAVAVTQSGVPSGMSILRWFSNVPGEDAPAAVTLEEREISAIPGIAVAAREAMQAEGLVFDGWWTDPVGGEPVLEGSAVAGDQGFYAHWTRKLISFTFHYSGETEEDWWNMTELEFGVGEAIVPPVLTREGHVFVGWQPHVPSVVAWDVGNTAFVAQWAKLHAAEFGWQDEEGAWHVVEKRNVPDGSALGELPPGPERDGYVFDGWVQDRLEWREEWDAMCGTIGQWVSVPYAADAEAVVTNDVAIYARWVELHRIAFDANGGVVDEPERFVRDRAPLGEPPIPVRDGYLFTGWTKRRNGGSWYDKDERAWDDFTFYAQWMEAVTVTLDAAGGTVASNSVLLAKNSHADMLEDPVRDKHVFLGWFTDAVGGRLVTATTKITSDVTFFAHWQYVGAADDATVSYEMAEGYIAESDVEFVLDMSDLIGSTSVPKVTVKGLPTGLRYDAKRMTIVGKATKPGVYAVTVSATNATVKKPVSTSFTITVPNLTDGEIPVADGYGPFVPGVEYAETVAAAAGCKVSGLPSGMKWTAKDVVDAKTKAVKVPANSFYGAATKPGSYTVYFTKTVAKAKHTATATFTVGPFPKLSVEMSGDTGKDKATGAGDYAANKKVTLKATPDKGKAFAGWYDAEGEPLAGAVDYRTASFPYVTTETNVTLTALFATEGEDKSSLKLVNVTNVTAAADGSLTLELGACVESLSLPKLAVSGLPSGLKYDAKTLKVSGKATKPGVYKVKVAATNTSVKKATDDTTASFDVTVPNFESDKMPGLLYATGAYGTNSVGVAFGADRIDCTPAEGWTVKVSGLPAGLKYDAKTGKISGVPTKAGAFTVMFTLSKKGEKNEVATITLNIEAMPTEIVGSYTGMTGRFEDEGDDDSWLAHGMMTLSVAANGKLSAKATLLSGTISFSANGWDSASDGIYRVEMLAKAGDRLFLELDGNRDWRGARIETPASVLETAKGAAYLVVAWRNEHGKTGNIAGDKTASDFIASIVALKKLCYVVAGDAESGYTCTAVPAADKSANLTLTFDAKGNVKYSGKIGGKSISGTAVLNIDGDDYYTIGDLVVPLSKKEALYLALGFDRDDEGEPEPEVEVFHVAE